MVEIGKRVPAISRCWEIRFNCVYESGNTPRSRIIRQLWQGEGRANPLCIRKNVWINVDRIFLHKNTQRDCLALLDLLFISSCKRHIHPLGDRNEDLATCKLLEPQLLMLFLLWGLLFGELQMPLMRTPDYYSY